MKGKRRQICLEKKAEPKLITDYHEIGLFTSYEAEKLNHVNNQYTEQPFLTSILKELLFLFFNQSLLLFSQSVTHLTV